MSHLKNAFTMLTVLALSWLTWNIWFPAATVVEQVDVRAWLPERPEVAGVTKEKWRVITKRMVWKKAVDAFQQRLDEKHLAAIVLQRNESVYLHVFDDPRHFKTHEEAALAKRLWGIDDVDILMRQDGTFMLGLGRFFITAYAEQRQDKLKRRGLNFTYQQQTKTIPTYRFVFAALSKHDAETLWKNVQEMGAVDPMIMGESEFNATFVGNVSAPS